jgi:hypothetical protein
MVLGSRKRKRLEKLKTAKEGRKLPVFEDQAFLDFGAREKIPRHISGKSGSPEPRTGHSGPQVEPRSQSRNP